MPITPIDPDEPFDPLAGALNARLEEIALEFSRVQALAIQPVVAPITPNNASNISVDIGEVQRIGGLVIARFDLGLVTENYWCNSTWRNVGVIPVGYRPATPRIEGIAAGYSATATAIARALRASCTSNTIQVCAWNSAAAPIASRAMGQLVWLTTDPHPAA
ncbi:MAG: hypothetical protein ACK5O2_00855 [Microthrixaceae bacterium]